MGKTSQMFLSVSEVQGLLGMSKSYCYDSTLRKELEAVEVATAADIVVAVGYEFDVKNDFEGISYNENAVSVSYYADRSSFDGNKVGEYETYYKVVPISGKEPYLICRTISVREPETAKTADDSGETETGEDEPEPGKAEVPDLAEGEMPELTTDNPVTFRLTSEAVMMAATFNAPVMKRALMLKHGSYAVEEITAPDGYLIAGSSFPFTVTKEGAVKVEEDIDGDPVIEVVAENTPVKGSITVHKTGEVLARTEYETIIDRILSRLTGSERGVRFIYEEQNLSGAVFHVVAEESIYTPDHQKGEDGERQPAIIGGVPAVKGAVVATLTTDGNGEAKIEGLPLGRYQIVEVNPPEGFAPCEEAQSVELSYADQNTEIVYGAADFVNARVKTEISLVKTDSDTTYPVSGAVYGIYVAEDIVKVNGGELKPAQAASGSGADADSSATVSCGAVASDGSPAVTENKSSNTSDDEEITESETKETADSGETDDSEEIDDSEKDDGAEAEDNSGEVDNPASQETQKPDGTQSPETESGKADNRV